MAATPSPISIDPTQAWEGNDGPWSTFFLGVGTPVQYFRVLISLSTVQPWVVVPEGCTSSDPSDCSSHRGGLFNRNASSTWRESGLYTLVFEENLGYFDNGIFGFDSISMGLLGTSAPKVDNQVLAGIASKDFYLGLWGVGPRPTNLTALNNPYPSLMTNLKEQNLVPSISYGYTAGAQYRSLTLGGYDASRFTPSNASFDFAGDVSRDLVVGLQSISVDGLDDSNIALSLLPDPILTFIDAGVPQIWLPQAACDVFENTFGLTYDPTTSLYLVNDTTHDALLSRNATITFKIGPDTSGPSTVEIQFPYAAFDLQLTADYPGINETTHYFPIRRAANDTQYTLGRTFLQQAYIVADYERSNFSVNPCIFADETKQDLRSILPLSDNSTSESNSNQSHSSPSLAAGAIAGIAVGIVVVILLLSGATLIFWRQRRRKERGPKFEPIEKDSKGVAGMGELYGKDSHNELNGDMYHRTNLNANHDHGAELKGDTPLATELNGGQNLKFVRELSGDQQRFGEMTGDYSHPSELGDPRITSWEMQGSDAIYELDSTIESRSAAPPYESPTEGSRSDVKHDISPRD